MSNYFSTSPRQYSRDYYVRLGLQELLQIDFCHLYSEVFETQDGLLHGVTEWTAQHSLHGALSLAWDWVRLSDGGIQLQSPIQVRTNIMLISAQGYDQGLNSTDMACVQCIGQLQWQGPVVMSLNGGLLPAK